jgi:hypothetical protein
MSDSHGERWRLMLPEYRKANPVVPMDWLSGAHLFLQSIASANPQTEQAEWMVKQAREGLRRSGGPDPAFLKGKAPTMAVALVRIEELEGALREIIENANTQVGPGGAVARIARTALGGASP